MKRTRLPAHRRMKARTWRPVRLRCVVRVRSTTIKAASLARALSYSSRGRREAARSMSPATMMLQVELLRSREIENKSSLSAMEGLLFGRILAGRMPVPEEVRGWGLDGGFGLVGSRAPTAPSRELRAMVDPPALLGVTRTRPP